MKTSWRTGGRRPTGASAEEDGGPALRPNDRSPAGPVYGDQLAIARRAEAAGFEALFRSDHYESFPGPAGRPTTDAWTVLAGLARDTERIRLGVLVSPVDVPATRDAREGRGDGQRDERRSNRGRPRGGLERGRASPPRCPVPADLASGPTCSRSSWRSSTGSGTSPTAGRSAEAHYRVEERSSGQKPTPPAADHRRWRGFAAVAPDRRALRR